MAECTDDMRFESKRRQSFFSADLGQTLHITTIRNLARAGFYYTGWEYFIQCEYCCKRYVCLIDADARDILNIHTTENNCDVRRNPKEICLHDDVYDMSSMVQVSLAASVRPRNIRPRSTHQCHRPRFPEYSRSNRLRTFTDDITTGGHDKQDLASAGFFYGGVTGRVRCYSCGIEVHTDLISQAENSFELHSRLRPTCYHVERRGCSPNRTLSPSRRHGPTQVHSASSQAHIPASNPTQHFASSPAKPGAASPEFPPSHPSLQERAMSSMGNYRRLNPNETSGRHESTPAAAYETFASQTSRLASYSNWPANGPVMPEQLAEAGFFHNVSGDNVRCAYCRGVLRNWEAGDDPWIEHARWFPHCTFVLHTKGQDFVDRCRDNNAAATADDQWRCTQGSIWNGARSKHLHPATRCSRPPGGSIHCSSGQQQQPDISTVASEDNTPNYSALATVRSRTTTFHGWPDHHPVRANTLVVAGFFYLGYEDRVQCFWCGCILSQWTEADDPWSEHRRWFPSCGFLRTCDQVRSKQNDTTSNDTCIICCNDNVNSTFLPCQHKVSCWECAVKLDRCAVCRRDIYTIDVL